MFSLYTAGSSVSTKRPQGDSKHIAGSGSSSKVPPSPLISGDHKKTPTPSTVSTEPPEELMTDTQHICDLTSLISLCALHVPYRTASCPQAPAAAGTLQSLREPLWEYRTARTGTATFLLMYRVFVSRYESRGSTHQTNFCEVDWC